MVPSSWKLRLAPLFPALAAALTAGLLVWRLVPAALEDGVARHLLDTTRLLSPLVGAQRASAGDPAALADWSRTLVRGTPLRLTIIDQDGTVVADSAIEPGHLGEVANHLDRPEVQAALQAGEGRAIRSSSTTGVRYVYVARLITDSSGQATILRLAQPIEALGLVRRQLVLAVVPMIVATLVALAAIALWLNRRFLKPLLAVIAGASRLAEGKDGSPLELPEDDQLRSLVLAFNRLSARVKEQISAAEAERDHVQTILKSMAEGVLVVGAGGVAELANPAFRRLFACGEGVLGLTPLEISRNKALSALVEQTLKTGKQGTAEVDLDLPERRTLSLASASLGEEQGVVVVVRDITAFTRLAMVRRDFVANVSHELKTPLSAIRGYAETLADGALDDRPTAGRFVERILAQCRRLQALLEDLLTLSRLESTEVTSLPAERVALAPLVERAAELVVAPARERQVELTVDADPEAFVFGHGPSLERLVVNLLDNAVKYNRPGGKVAASVKAEGGEVRLEVQDTGIGIPPDSIPRLFERFYRVDKGRSRDEGGTGLGLAIVKHTAQVHNGRVEVESKEGVGSTFRVMLPAAPTARASVPPPPG